MKIIDREVATLSGQALTDRSTNALFATGAGDEGDLAFHIVHTLTPA
jgi:hypothetical protein